MEDKNFIKLQKRKKYMREYYLRKKAERIASGNIISVSKNKTPRQGFFTIKRGEFIVNFN